MKYITTIIATVFLLTPLTGCMGEFGDINYNPNKPQEAYTSMLFTASAKYVPDFIMNSTYLDPWMQEWTGYLSETKNSQFGTFSVTERFGTTNYYRYTLKNLNLIIDMNRDEARRNTPLVRSFGSNENQIAAALTLRSFFYMSLTDILGPIPYKEAFQGVGEGNWTPKFDSQEDVYTYLDADLKEAYGLFDTSSSLSSADILYKGDVGKWKKFNATLRMMLAVKLAKVDPTNGKERFAQAYSDGGMKEVADGFNYTFDSNSFSFMYYIGNKTYSSRNVGFGPNKVFVDALKEHRDPRLFTYCTLDGYLGKRPGDPADFDAYLGTPFGLASNDEVSKAMQVSCSIADSYCEPQTTYGVITTARALLVAAEAAQLGWIAADAKQLYADGIRASFQFTGTKGAEEYITSEKVALSDNRDAALKQIVMQRFLAGFMTDAIESWSDWRRYNIPTIPVYPAQEASGATVYPYRMKYADADLQYNRDNYNNMVQQHFGGYDDRWSRLWWMGKE
ncbi:MAG: SusD/RagB family nutrient-binding outer membrane lipoprotein [Mediterranea sp.]|jgi:hypothetical protein|nr:SusD/RagB family nutrient-binding outer membrane lipoprotein [Mediterranea sp.]